MAAAASDQTEGGAGISTLATVPTNSAYSRCILNFGTPVEGAHPDCATVTSPCLLHSGELLKLG